MSDSRKCDSCGALVKYGVVTKQGFICVTCWDPFPTTVEEVELSEMQQEFDERVGLGISIPQRLLDWRPWEDDR